MFVTTKHIFCRDKKYAWHEKTCVTTHTFVATNICQDKFCREKCTFVTTKDVFCHERKKMREKKAREKHTQKHQTPYLSALMRSKSDCSMVTRF